MQLQYQEWGTGHRTALLIHGLDQESNTWWRFGPDLAEQGFRVVAPDLRGHGNSPRAARYTPTDWSLDIIDTFAGTEIDLAVGHSLGGLALSVASHALRPHHTVYLAQLGGSHQPRTPRSGRNG